MYSSKHWLRLLLLIAISGLGLHAQAQKKTLKKRVAVFVFQDKSDGAWQWHGNRSTGEGVTDMVVTELVQSGQYRVIEREQLNSLLAEQELGVNSVVTPETAAEVGKVLGVEIAIMGAITEFGYKRDDKDVRIGGTNIGIGKQSAIAGIDLRMVNTSTGEILLAENIRRSRNALDGSFSKGGFGFDSQKSFDESLVGKVTREAVEEVVNLVNRRATDVTWQGKVITVQGDMVYINRGSVDGVKVGDEFKVIRQGEALIDPDTGLNLGTINREIGALRVADNTIGDGKAAVCTILRGADFQREDVIRE